MSNTWPRLRAAVLAAGLIALAVGAAHAAESYFGLTFPDAIGGAHLGKVTDFEKTNPGLGYGAGYEKPGWVINVYLYDDGIGRVPADLYSDVMQSQLKQAQGDIVELGRRGTYADVAFKRSYTLRDTAGVPRFLCSDYTFTRSDMGSVDSFLCLTYWKGRFVKFRLTVGDRADAAREAVAFVTAWTSVLWPK